MMAETRQEENSAWSGGVPKRICPLLGEAHDDCLASRTMSANVETIIRLCGGDYETCEIYQRKKQKINLLGNKA